MTLLQSIPNNLETIARQLDDDNDIKSKILLLVDEAGTVSGRFTDVMQSEGRNVLSDKRALMALNNPSEVDVQNLKDALKALQRKLQEMRDAMFILQGHVHSRIEECRAHSRELEHTVGLTNIEMERLRTEISYLKEQIQECEKDASNEDKRADASDAKAREFKDEAERRRATGVGSSLMIFSAGLIAAPFTGGTSVAFASCAAAGNLGGHLYSASQCDEDARCRRKNASEKRQEAERFRKSKRDKIQDMANKETKANSIRQRNDKIITTCRKLNDIGQQLRSSIDIINAVIKNVQDLDTTLYAAEQQGNSFKIIQSAFGKNPEKLEGRALHYLNELKAKWYSVEKDIEQAAELRSVRY